MKRTFFILLAFLGSVVAMSSCHKDNTVTFSFTSQDFVNRAASAFNFQIQAGYLAQSRGVNDSVRAFGTLMIKADTASLRGLKTLAAAKGLTVSSTLQANDQTNLSALQADNGKAFDQAYAQTMVLSNNQELSFFNLAAQSNGVADADMRTFAFSQVPQVSLFSQKAYVLQSAVAAEQ